jgi:hypothetical protein
MSTFASWSAAMNVFLYPQNLLLPSMRAGSQTSPPTPAFEKMLTEVLNSAPLNPTLARNIAGHYLAELRKDPNLPAELGATSGATALSDQISDSDLGDRAVQIKTWWTTYTGNSDANKRLAYLNYLAEIFYFVPLHLALRLQQDGQFVAALDWYRTIYAYQLPTGRKIWYGLVAEEAKPTSYERLPTWLVEPQLLNPHQLVENRARAYTRFTIISLVRCLLQFADSEFAAYSFETVPHARSLYLTALRLLDSPDLTRFPGEEEKTPENEVATSLRRHVELNLLKLRAGRNIAGMFQQAQARPDAAKPATLQPAEYSYQTLIDRAKQLVTLAQQAESSFLASLEKSEAEFYTEQKAQQDLDVAKADVALQNLMVSESIDSVTLAFEQRDRAESQVKHYRDLINSDILPLEGSSLGLMGVELELQTFVASNYAYAAVQSGLSVEDFLNAGAGVSQNVAAAGSATAAAVGIGASMFSALASIEEKAKDWQSQLSLSLQDIAISTDQIKIALDHQAVATQQQAIASVQAQNAAKTVNFLTKQKVTNAVLYEWMSEILQRIYEYFLQQAATVARQAQNQLAFERQEQPVNVIQVDYWQAPSDVNAPGSSAATGAGTVQPTDTRGLTGSARLLQDIYKLDQYAFETNQRKLQITKIISLAQHDPFAFQQFQENGVLRFATSEELFDADFPGHYLRLIQQVRTSVIALVPPIQGIRATLLNTGVSRVTVGNDDAFTGVVVRRAPQEVALSSPINAAGVFQLDPQQGLLLPFQGLGVDGSWEFRMPKAANPIDYNTIADVLITIDYTALDSPDYRQQVTQRLRRSFSADRGYSFRQQFADAWYELNNPDQSPSPMQVQFSITRQDFPPHLEDGSLSIEQVLLQFVPKNGASFQIAVKDLQFTPEESQAPVDGGGAGPTAGTFSTRRGNAADWTALIGKPPFGQWQLTLPDDTPTDPQVPRNLIKNGQITDILFVITYSGETPAWPT